MDKLYSYIFTSSLLDSYANAQRKNTLKVILWVTCFASLVLGFSNLHYGDIPAGIVVILLAPTALAALYLEHIGYFNLASILLSIMLLMVTDFDLLSSGGLTNDLGVMAFPVIIMITSLFFGKNGTYVFSTLSIISVLIIGYFDLNQMISGLTKNSDIYDLVTVLVFVMISAVIIWVIIDNSESNLKRIKNDEERLRTSYELTLEGLVMALEVRDQETEGHSRRVVDLSVRLAQKLGIKGEKLEILKRGALLHDIGKLGIPDHILLKPGPLTEEERTIMKQHPSYAMGIISKIPFLQPCLDIPYCHHEAWDGTGYPQGLKGSDIPFNARLFTLIDQWEALNSDRPYRKAWERQRVIDYIKENKGKIYDPSLTDTFLRMVEKEENF